MRTSQAGIHLIEQFEGFVPHIYYDAVGVATVGYGTTTADIKPLPATVSRAQAETLLKRGLELQYEPAVNELGARLNQNQFDALVSLAYNCGPGAMSWQIGRDARAGNMGAVANDFQRYVYAGGRVLQGLVNRRQAERALFLTPVKQLDLYSIFPDRVLIHDLNERDVIVHTDGALQHPEKYRTYLKENLYPSLKRLRDRCYRIAKYAPPNYTKLREHALWNDSRQLGLRWQELNNRMKKIAAIK